MIGLIPSEDFLLRCAPVGSTAIICVLEADDMVDIDEVTSFASVKAYGGVGLITAVLEVFAIVAVCTGQ